MGSIVVSVTHTVKFLIGSLHDVHLPISWEHSANCVYTVFRARWDTHDLRHPDFRQASKTKFYLCVLRAGTEKGGTPSKELFGRLAKI